MPAHAADQHEEERTNYCFSGVEEMNAGVKEVDSRKCPEYWKLIPGSDLYEVSTHGRVRNRQSGALIKIQHTGRTPVIVAGNGKARIGRSLKRVMWEAFIGRVPDECKVVTKSGASNVFELDDLMLEKKNQRVGIIRRKRVIKLDTSGNILAIYSSSSDCARAESWSTSSVSRRCRGETVNALDGYDFAYEDEPASVHRALTRLGVDWRRWKY